jgi:hypothetical protein
VGVKRARQEASRSRRRLIITPRQSPPIASAAGQTVDGQRGTQYVPRRQFDSHDVAFSEFEIRIDKHFQPAVTRTAGQDPCATTATGSATRARDSGFDVNDRTNAAGGPDDCDNGALRVIHDALPAQMMRYRPKRAKLRRLAAPTGSAASILRSVLP